MHTVRGLTLLPLTQKHYKSIIKIFTELQWIQIRNKDFTFVVDKINYDQAVKKCKSYGGILFEPKNADINKEVTDKAKVEGLDAPSWIGINDMKEENKFVYSSDNTSVTYENWKDGKPPKSKKVNKKDCVGLITQTENWNVYDCTTSKLDYICERNGNYLYWISRSDTKCVTVKVFFSCSFIHYIYSYQMDQDRRQRFCFCERPSKL